MPPEYVVRRSGSGSPYSLPPRDPAWARAAVITWGEAPYTTWFRALWSDRALSLRFDVADRSPWHTKTTRDDRLWEEEVVEIFLDPAHTGASYAELEISPANVVCDLLVRQPWPALISDPSWHIEGLDTAVVAWRDPEAGPDGWLATAHIPWPALSTVAGAASLPPRAGDVWGFNVFRIKRPDGPQRQDGRVLLQAWSPTGTPSFHVPSAFGQLLFE